MISLPIAAMGLSLSLTACAGAGATGPAASAEAAPGYPVSVENCGRTVTFDSAPERVVSLWQAPTEMMLALGLGDRKSVV